MFEGVAGLITRSVIAATYPNPSGVRPNLSISTKAMRLPSPVSMKALPTSDAANTSQAVEVL